MLRFFERMATHHSLLQRVVGTNDMNHQDIRVDLAWPDHAARHLILVGNTPGGTHVQQDVRHSQVESFASNVGGKQQDGYAFELHLRGFHLRIGAANEGGHPLCAFCYGEIAVDKKHSELFTLQGPKALGQDSKVAGKR